MSASFPIIFISLLRIGLVIELSYFTISCSSNSHTVNYHNKNNNNSHSN